MDLPLTKELFKITNLYFILDVPNYARNATVLEIEPSEKKAGIYRASDFPQFSKYSDYIDLKKTFIIYRTSNKTYSISNLLIQFKLAKLFKNLNPEIIHCNNFLNYNFSFFLKTTKTPKILTVHDPLPHSGEKSRKKENIRKLNFNYFDKIILLNRNQTEEFLASTTGPSKEIFYSRLGAYTYLKTYIKQNRLNKTKFNVLFFGRISPYKGVEELCKAFKELSMEYIEAKLVIAGSGPFWFDTTEYINSNNITFINRFISNSELVGLIDDSSFVVCPYKDATQSGVIMTSFALNKPVIATNVGGLKEMITHKKTGLLIEPNNTQELYLNIKYLFENPEILEEMEKNIIEMNKNGFLSWSNIAKDLVLTYKQIKN